MLSVAQLRFENHEKFAGRLTFWIHGIPRLSDASNLALALFVLVLLAAALHLFVEILQILVRLLMSR